MIGIANSALPRSRNIVVDKRVRRFSVTVKALRLNLVYVMQIAETNPLLDAKNLAKYLRVSARTLETLLGRGEGPPFIKLGRQRRWRQIDVDSWLQERASTTTKAQFN